MYFLEIFFFRKGIKKKLLLRIEKQNSVLNFDRAKFMKADFFIVWNTCDFLKEI